jgi:hypothetical protein
MAEEFDMTTMQRWATSTVRTVYTVVMNNSMICKGVLLKHFQSFKMFI